MANTRLILHVKGTEAETRELPKEAVRAGISQGKITYSQLIWSASENAWKQAREWPELMPGEPLILHVKGTEAETRTLPQSDVRSGIKQGEITHSQLIWSAAENTWKQVRELPELLPSQKLAPAPAQTPAPAMPVTPVAPEATAAPVARPAETATPQVRAPVALTGGPKPHIHGATPHAKVAGAPKVAGPPKVAVAGAPKVAAAAGAPRVAAAAPRAAAAGSASVRAKATAGRSSAPIKVKEEDDHAHPMRWLCIIMGSIIAVLLLANFFLVSLPLTTKFDRTRFSNVTVFAHLGAFMQPNVMVIHIVPSSAITRENLSDLMVALARSSPVSPLTQDTYERVAITSGWTAQYSFSGSSWKALAQLDQGDMAQRKELLVAQMDGPGGEPLMTASTLDEAAQQVKRDKIWNEFASHFARGQ